MVRGGNDGRHHTEEKRDMKLSVNTFLSIDGVMQSPGGVDEDHDGGFALGGWLVPHADEDMGRIVTGWFDRADAILLGRNTYAMMSAFWRTVTDPDNSVATALNNQPKFVASRTLSDADADWPDTTVLRGDVIEQVRELKQRPGREIQVHGSWQLARALHDAGLVDVYRQIVFPVVLGRGKRLFDENSTHSGFRTLSSELTGAGAISSTLEPVPFRTGDIVVVDGKEVVV